MTQFFGERWDAPVVDEAEAVPTPTTLPCMFQCGHPIVEGDRGEVSVSMDTLGNVWPVAWHMECHLPSVFGGPPHVRAMLTLGATEAEEACCSYPGQCMEGYADRRALGLAVLAEIDRSRAEQGRPPL